MAALATLSSFWSRRMAYSFLAADDRLLDGRRVAPHRLLDQRRLLGKDLAARNAGAGQEDDEADILRVPGGDHRGDQAALAVAHQADLLRVDLLAAFEEVDPGLHVGGEVGARCLGVVARGPAHPAIVDAQHRHAPAGEVVGQDEERLMPEQRLVAVLRPGARDQDHGGEGAVPPGQGERACELVARLLVLVGHLGRVVGEGGLGAEPPGSSFCSETLSVFFMVSGIVTPPSCFHSPAASVPAALSLPENSPFDELDLERQLFLPERDGVDLHALHALVGAVHRGSVGAVLLLEEVQDDPQLDARVGLERALPHHVGLLCGGGDGHGRGEREREAFTPLRERPLDALAVRGGLADVLGADALAGEGRPCPPRTSPSRPSAPWPPDRGCPSWRSRCRRRPS